MKVKIRLDTITDIANFVLIANSTSKSIKLIDNSGLCVDAKSFLGVAYAQEFKDLWCVSEEDLYNKLEPYIINE